MICRHIRLPTMSLHMLRALLTALMASAAVLVPVSGVSAQAEDADLADVEIVRYGGADRYSTSLLVAEAVAEDVGDGLE